MKKSRFSEEQIIGILKQGEAGVKTSDLCREHGIDAHGPPRLSLRRFGSGSRGPINSHWASVNNSNRFLLMQEAQQINRFTRKSLA